MTRLSIFFVGISITRLYRGSVGVDYIATFNNTSSVNSEVLKDEFATLLNVTQNGTFLGDLKLGNNTDPARAAEVLSFTDYDECNPAVIVHIPDCGINATCINRNSSYDCVCDEGFVNSDSGCIIIPIQRRVEKDKVDEVRYIIVAVIVWLCLCLLVAIILSILAAVSLRNGHSAEQPVYYGTEGRSMKSHHVVAPTDPAMDHNYSESVF